MSDTPTAEQRAEWQKLADEATPGPWVWEQDRMMRPDGWDGKDDAIIETDDSVYPPRQRDRAFIAAAREAVPALLAALSTVEAERDRLRETLELLLSGGNPT